MGHRNWPFPNHLLNTEEDGQGHSGYGDVPIVRSFMPPSSRINLSESSLLYDTPPQADIANLDLSMAVQGHGANAQLSLSNAHRTENYPSLLDNDPLKRKSFEIANLSEGGPSSSANPWPIEYDDSRNSGPFVPFETGPVEVGQEAYPWLVPCQSSPVTARLFGVSIGDYVWRPAPPRNANPNGAGVGSGSITILGQRLTPTRSSYGLPSCIPLRGLMTGITYLSDDASSSQSIPAGQNNASPPQSIPAGQNYASPPQSIPAGQNNASPPQIIPAGQNNASPPQIIPAGQNNASPPQIIPAGQNNASPPQSIPAGQNNASPPIPPPVSQPHRREQLVPGSRVEDERDTNSSQETAGSWDDQHNDMRMDIDGMSYEELLALEEAIGHVSTGLSEDFIQRNLKLRTVTLSRDLPSPDQQILRVCTVCQNEYEVGDSIGSLDCGHEYHKACIEQWLVIKNTCPVCKTTALSDQDQ